MSKIDQYTPAFPIPTTYSPNGDVQRGCDGMSLRAYLASNTDIPWNAVISTLEGNGIKAPTIPQVIEYRAKLKVMEADALIAELNKPTTTEP